MLPGSVQTLVLTQSSTTGDHGLCDFQAGNVDQLERAEEHPLKCDQCDKCFSQKEELVQHERTHTEDKPFECNQCGKRFYLEGNLFLHKEIHRGKPFECNYCNKCFSHKGHLNEHRRIHTGEKPFSCNQCDKRFNRKSLLKQHQVTHTRENCFEFTQFDQSSGQPETVERHIQTETVSNIHTGEETLKTSNEQDKSLNDMLGSQGVILEEDTEGTNLTGEPCKYKEPDSVGYKRNDVRVLRNEIFVHATRQSANHARALQVDSELFGCPSINYLNSIF